MTSLAPRWRWETYRTVLDGTSRVLLHVQALESNRPNTDILWVIQSGHQAEFLSAYLVSGESGTRLPCLGEGAFVIPRAAAGASLFLVFDTGPEPRGECELSAYASLDSHGSPETLEPIGELMPLTGAWQVIPSDLEEESQTLKRLVRSGGTESERRAYRLEALDSLARAESPRWLALKEDISTPLTLAGLPRDMQPLAYSTEIHELSKEAEKGESHAVRKGLEALPLTIQLNPDVRSLLDRARSVEDAPELGDENRLSRVHSAIAGSRYEEAISLALSIPSGRPLHQAAEQCRAEATVGLVWQLLDQGDSNEAKNLLSQEWLKLTLGQGHLGLAEVQKAFALKFESGE